jgi:hypothetical protein
VLLPAREQRRQPDWIVSQRLARVFHLLDDADTRLGASDCELLARLVGPSQIATSARPGDKTRIELDVRFPKLRTIRLCSTDGYHPFLDVWDTSAFFRAAGRAGLLEVFLDEHQIWPAKSDCPVRGPGNQLRTGAFKAARTSRCIMMILSKDECPHINHVHFES